MLRWIECLEVTGLEPLALAHRLGPRATYSHVERLEAAGLVERIYDRGGSLVAITSAGRREARPESYDRRSARPSLTGGTLTAHARATSWAAARSTLRGLPWVSDREMRSLPDWQVPVLWDRRGNHRPDLGVTVEGSRLAVEVELTAKSAARLQTILSGYQMQLATGRFIGLIYVTDNARVRAVVQRALRVERIHPRQFRFLDFDEMQARRGAWRFQRRPRRRSPPRAAAPKQGRVEVPRAPSRPLRSVPRYALTRAEAAAALGMSINHFERKVQPDLRVVLSGQLVLIPVPELERWVQRNARRIVARPVGGPRLPASGSRSSGPPRRPRPAEEEAARLA